MSHDSWHCKVCNGNFDHGEPCDCNKRLPFVTVPNDYGTHTELYREELSLNIIKVKFLRSGEPSGRPYTYFSEHPVVVGDKVEINSASVGVVTEIDVPEEEIVDYRDKCKYIHGKYVEPFTEVDKAESVCYGCSHNDTETGMCASYEGCIRAKEEEEENL
jgi:hypothetical protein